MKRQHEHALGRTFEEELRSRVFPGLSATIVRQYGEKLKQRTHGDFQIRWREELLNVDAKAEAEMPDNFPIELLQDWPSIDLGWWYTLNACHQVWYGQYRNGSLAHVHVIDLLLLRRMQHETLFSHWRPRVTHRGFGATVVIPAPLSELRKAGVLETVFPSDNQTPNRDYLP